MPFRNPLCHRARCKGFLHNPKLVGRCPSPPPFTADPNLNLLRKVALKRPLTSLVRRLAHLRGRPSRSPIQASPSRPRRGRCCSTHAYRQTSAPPHTAPL